MGERTRETENEIGKVRGREWKRDKKKEGEKEK